jgi:hypothetical protein
LKKWKKKYLVTTPARVPNGKWIPKLKAKRKKVLQVSSAKNNNTKMGMVEWLSKNGKTNQLFSK